MDQKTQGRMTRTEARRWLVLLGLGFLTSGFLFAINGNDAPIGALTNYPNPFNSRIEETFISYRLPQDLPVRIRIYDLFGFLVREFNLSPGDMGARLGENKVRWDGTDESGQKVAKGGYVCQVTVEGDQPARAVRKIGVVH